MSFRVRTTRRAEADAEAAYGWIAENEGQPINALRWLDGFQDAIGTLREFPFRCPFAPESVYFDREVRQILFHSHRDSHPKLGASFEGFALDQVLRRLQATPKQCYFWATHQGAELDLLVVSGRRRLGFEFKHTNAPGATKSMRIATLDLKLERLDVIHVGDDTYPLSDGIRTVALKRVRQDIEPL